MNKISALTNQILDLWADNLSTLEISKQCGTTRQYVCDVALRARKRGDPRAVARADTALALKVSRAIRNTLERKAVLRGVTPSELANDLIIKIVTDDLFDAVLDDGDGA